MRPTLVQPLSFGQHLMRIAPSGYEQSRGPLAGSAKLVAPFPAAMPLIVWAVL